MTPDSRAAFAPALPGLGMCDEPVEAPLAGTGTDLAPCFPAPERGTGVVLGDGGPGEVRAFWCLRRDDLNRGGGRFGAAHGHPHPVLRLRRLLASGGAEVAAEVRLAGPGRRQAGETPFRLTPDHGRYQVELGLTDGSGAWLMLARSNPLDNVSPVGLDPGRLTVRPSPVPLPLAPAPGSLARDPAREVPAAGLDAGPAGTGAAPPDPEMAPGLEPQLAAPGEPQDLAPSFPLVWPRGGPAGDLGPGGAPVFGDLPVRGLGPLDPRVARGRDGAVPALDEPPGPDAGRWVGAGRDPSWVLVYGQAPSWTPALELEAELRISGRGPSGTLLDLFGFPFRIGPGGRFQLTLPVDDPALLRRALELHPPPELTMAREN